MKNVVIIGTEEYAELKKCKFIVEKGLENAKSYIGNENYIDFDIRDLVKLFFPDEYNVAAQKAVKEYEEKARLRNTESEERKNV